MSHIREFGVEADERQELELLRAGHRAFLATMRVAVAAIVVALLVLRDESMAIALAVVVMTGVIVHETLVQRSGWEAFMQEQIAHRWEVRRRVIRSIVLRGLVLGGFCFLYNYIIDEKTLGGSAIHALWIGGSIATAYWWFEVRAALRKGKKKDGSMDGVAAQ